ncbi:Aste57867_17394 [Aphanomyces stellatus]|uniref:Amino acid transporter n=1 Tax=Aphanomyces stellatus TaxID=120398 RepID=A0A485L9C0_9STRA|nr:hypothetical protein As57867_017334 [Aphanomyces stellatus]VFT94150.1 Aste57867_17394 [Aphanomyces stellatus]
MEPKKQGILLYEDLEVGNATSLPPRRTHHPSPGPPSSASSGPSNRSRTLHHPDGGTVRTNFTTDTVSSTMDFKFTTADNYSDSPMLGDFNKAPSSHPLVATPKPGDGGGVVDNDYGLATPQFSPLMVFLGAAVGLGFGILFYHLNLSSELLKLISLPGNLFVRGLQCLIVPMVFCVMIHVVADTVAMGRASILRWRTLVPYALTSTLSAAQGIAISILFASYFTPKGTTGVGDGHDVAASAPGFNLTMRCANGLFLAPTTAAGGALACVEANASATSALFLAVNHTVAAVASLDHAAAGVQTLSLADQVISVANLIVPVNIFASLLDGSLLSIVMFSIPLGIAAAHSAIGPNEPNHVLTLVRQLRNIFLRMLRWLLALTPVAVAFLIASAVAKFDSQDLAGVISQIGYLFLAFVIASFSHALVVLPTLLYVYTKSNPFRYLQHMVPAYVFAFGCASSMATLPVAIACIQRAKVSRTLAHIAMPFGTPVNMNSCGIYYTLAVVFMAKVAGLGDQLTTTKYVVVFFVSLLGSMCTAPVPNAALVYIVTLWKIVFSVPLPPSFAYVMAADFILDRIATTLNVHGNICVTRILADQIDETFEVHAAQRI